MQRSLINFRVVPNLLGRASTRRASSTTTEVSKTLDFEDFLEDITETPSDQKRSFASLLRHSKFMQLGDFDGRLVTGKIVQRVHDDLYVDFGLKFNAVCKAPAVNSDAYRSGARVLLRLHDPELSERFLGSKHDLTLLEADATLVRFLGNSGGAPPQRKGGRRPQRSPTEKPADDVISTDLEAGKEKIDPKTS
ncbi:unnamed protein product [Caenorhabditis auriculariae]|uniref:Uncharacterized protein n=1 Tax=Caenorhabditis auriculariae TaxID=2777116 RepID=A0A8S1H0E1_9PELO|nr:unnamed protein product [Caenorhabditis auriculariae]